MSILDKIKLQLKTSRGSNKKKKNSPLTKWRIITMLITTLLIIGIFSTFYFAYNNIYLTLANAHSIFILESNIGEEGVDAVGYVEAKKYIEQKKDKINLNKNLRNIFEYDITTTTADISTTTLELN